MNECSVSVDETGPMNRPSEPLVCSLLAHARAQPERTALLAGDRTVSFGRLVEMIAAAAARLDVRGVAPGDRVLLCGPNSPELAAAYFAVHAVGAMAVPLGPDVPVDAARQLADDCEPSLALLAVDLKLPAASEDLLSACRVTSPPPPLEPRCYPNDPADLLYTTGTTGRKKGVVLSHRQIAQAAANINAFIGPCPDDVELVPLPLSHSFGLGRLRCMAQAGHALALEPGLRNAAGFLMRLLDLKATGLALVPAGFDLLLRMTKGRLADARDHLRYVEIGSAAMPLETKRRLMELLPRTRICHHFGMTEASRAAFLDYHAHPDRLDSIGRPSPNVEIDVHDEQGRPLPPGEPGELVIRGGMVMTGYWRHDDLTAQTLRDNWLRSGDWGYRDADGFLYLLGRRQDTINVGGLKVAPEEVEEILNRHPEIVESACIGAADPQGVAGQVVKAFVVSRSDVALADLTGWLRGRIEEYKIPRLLARVERIEKTDSGKIKRHLLAEGEATDRG